MDGVEVYRWFLTASPFELRIVYFNSQLVDFTLQTAMRSRINYALTSDGEFTGYLAEAIDKTSQSR